MAINLDEHKVFVKELNIEMVPLSVAKKAVEESYMDQLHGVMSVLTKQMGELNPLIDEIERGE